MMKYSAHLGRYIDLRRGLVTNGMHDFVMDEIEVGARAAHDLDDPEQTFWALNQGPKESSL